jgi:thiamine biosynthesis lipoprotein
MASQETPFFILNAFKGLGTAFWIELFLHENEKKSLPLTAIQKHLEETITSFDNTYSRFKEDSLLSQLNRERTIPYDHHLAMMLTQAKEVSIATDTIFSLFIKEALEKKGYGEQIGTPSAQFLLKNPSITSDFVISKTSITLIGSKGVDLGGIGKGYLIDMLVDILRKEFSLQYFLINGGGDIYVSSNHGEAVELYLEHPTNEDEYIAKILLKDKAFCCSSSFKRRWEKDGKMVNHFIAPTDVWAASYLTGPTTTITDMYATVFCICAQNESQLEKFSTISHVEYFVIKNDGKTLTSKGFNLLS